MNGFIRLILILSISFTMVRCSTLGQGEEAPATEDSAFNDFDSGGSESSDSSSAASESSAPSESSEVSIEDELNQSEGAPAQAAAEPAPTPEESNQDQQPKVQDEFADFGEPQQKTEEVPPPQVVEAPIEAPPPEEVPPPVVEPTPLIEEPVKVAQAEITNIRYKANDNGGTVVIDGSQVLQYQTRMNSETNQLIIEMPNTNLPDKLKRPLNTKDMSGGIGAIDAYQNSGSTTARIVIQMRPGAPEPVVQPEGNALLIIQPGSVQTSANPEVLAESSTAIEAGGAPSESPLAAPESSSGTVDGGSEMALNSASGAVPGRQEKALGGDKSENSILSTSSLSEFLTGNTQFYGTPMSIDVSEMEIKEVFKLIAEESGINIVLSDEVKGTITLKLKDVPWDQVFVILLKSKKLGYTRSGNIIRVATMADIKSEEAEALKMIADSKAQAPLKVKVLPVSYSDIKKVEGDVSKLLSERGRVIGDQRTSSLMISDHQENIERIERLLKAIDIPPPQVLIEGKIVEATDQFQRSIGVNWSASGQESSLGKNNLGRVIRGRSTLNIAPTVGSTAATAQLGFAMGTLDVLGDIDATLSLFENNSQVKVLSSPRIVTLHGEKAEINQTVAIPVLKESANGTQTTRSADFKDVSLKLTVTPQITNDASVILDVNVARSFLSATVDQASGVKAINTRSATTKVMVKNAQTAVIGGVYQSDQTFGEQKVPWLGEIPILGWLFKNRSTEDNKNELLIFITPRILSHTESQIVPTEIGGIN